MQGFLLPLVLFSSPFFCGGLFLSCSGAEPHAQWAPFHGVDGIRIKAQIIFLSRSTDEGFLHVAISYVLLSEAALLINERRRFCMCVYEILHVVFVGNKSVIAV